MNRGDAIRNPGREKDLTGVIGPSGGRCAAKMPWKPIIQQSGGEPAPRNLSASRSTLSTR